MSFPNLKNKHAKDSMVEPKEFAAYAIKIGKYERLKSLAGIIFCYKRSFMDYLIKNHKVKKLKSYYGELYLLKEKNCRIGIIGKFGIGAPAAATLMEELIALGAKKFLTVGTAGALQKNLKVGSLVVCNKAIRDEGTSHHYFPHSKYAFASKTLLKKIEKTLKKLNLGYAVGSSWTIDAPYRETVEEVKKYQKEGVLTVEMEAAAIFSVAKFRKVEAAAIFLVSDYLGELEWKPKFHLTQKYNEKLFKAAKQSLLD